VELLGPLRGSAHRTQPHLVRRGDGQTIQLTALLYSVLEAIDGHRTYDDLAAAVTEAAGKQATAEDAQYLVEEKLEPLGLVRRADGSVPEVSRTNPLLALRFRVAVSDPTMTRRLTDPFTWLFRPAFVLAILVTFALSTAWLLFDKGLASPTHQAFDDPALLLTVFVLTLVSAGFHEFGHAAACRYGGATPGVMGCGLYLLWPAFYTDVTDSYRLGKASRLRVDLGGLYFNAVFGVATFALWGVTRWDALLLVLPAQLLQMLRQLAPFIRADGYHIIADLVGVPDLFAHIKPTLLGFLPTHWGRPETRTLKWWARLVIVAWVLIVVPLLLGFLVFSVLMFPRLAATAWASLGREWSDLVADLSSGAPLDALVGVLSMVAIALPVFAITYLIWRVASRTVRRTAAATAGRPVLRGAAVAAGAGVLAFVTWAWWPGDQYEPIRPDERGAVQDVQLLLTKPAAASTTGTGMTGLSGSAPVGAGMPVAGAPSSGVTQPAMVLIPRDESAAAVVVVAGSAGEAPEVLTIEPTEDGDWPFPFPEPPPRGEGDNRAYAVNTTDGTMVYDVAFSLVWVVDDDVELWNEAWALASCADCGTVAVAFQTILIVGRADVVAPVNAAVSVNYECERCDSWAIAVQLVATLKDMPSDAVIEQINAIWARLLMLEETIESLGPAGAYYELKAIEAEILHVLLTGGHGAAVSSDTAVDGIDPQGATTTSESTTSTTAADPSDASSTTTTTSDSSTSTSTSTSTTEATTTTVSDSASTSTTTSTTTTTSPPTTSDPEPTDASTSSTTDPYGGDDGP
jgi:putative peptide zinc metalloprotease protein